MVFSNEKKDDGLHPTEEPPSYDDVTRNTPSDHAVNQDSKKRSLLTSLTRTAPKIGSSSSRLPKPQSPTPSSSSSWIRRTIRNASSSSSRPANSSQSSDSLPTPRSQEEVRNTVLGLIRDLVAGPQSSLGVSLWSDGGLATMGVLDSCVAVCARQQVSLSAILQELSVEGHTPVYWAIVQRPQSSKATSDDVLMKLFSLCAPLTQYTLYDLRLACLVAYSNSTLQRIRSSPSLYPYSGTDCMLLQGTDATAPSRGFRDVVEVTEGSNSQGSEVLFSVKMELEMFQRRMRVSKEVQVEFIARGRIWSLIFFVVPSNLPHPYLYDGDERINDTTSLPQAAYTALRMLNRPIPAGTWACCLSLRSGSAECWVDARVMVNEPGPETYNRPDRVQLADTNAKGKKALSDPDISYSDSEGHRYSQIDSFNRGGSSSYTQHLTTSDVKQPYPSHAPTVPADANSYPSSHHFSSQHTLRPSSSKPSFLSSLMSSTLVSTSSKLITMSSKSWSPSPISRKSKPPLTLRLKSTYGPLAAPPPPPYKPLPLSLVPSPNFAAVTKSGKGCENRKLTRKERKEAKKEAKVRAARERRAREGKETKKERTELDQEAHTVIVVGLGDGADKDGMGKLMFDGCPYIARDGFLRANLEANLGKPEAECIIC